EVWSERYLASCGHHEAPPAPQHGGCPARRRQLRFPPSTSAALRTLSVATEAFSSRASVVTATDLAVSASIAELTPSRSFSPLPPRPRARVGSGGLRDGTARFGSRSAHFSDKRRSAACRFRDHPPSSHVLQQQQASRKQH